MKRTWIQTQKDFQAHRNPRIQNKDKRKGYLFFFSLGKLFLGLRGSTWCLVWFKELSLKQREIKYNDSESGESVEGTEKWRERRIGFWEMGRIHASTNKDSHFFKEAVWMSVWTEGNSVFGFVWLIRFFFFPQQEWAKKSVILTFNFRGNAKKITLTCYVDDIYGSYSLLYLFVNIM